MGSTPSGKSETVEKIIGRQQLEINNLAGAMKQGGASEKQILSAKKGDHFVCGPQWGKVRAIIDDNGKSVYEALPSTPVEILGISGASKSGDDFLVLDSDKEVKV